MEPRYCAGQKGSQDHGIAGKGDARLAHPGSLEILQAREKYSVYLIVKNTLFIMKAILHQVSPRQSGERNLFTQLPWKTFPVRRYCIECWDPEDH